VSRTILAPLSRATYPSSSNFLKWWWTVCELLSPTSTPTSRTLGGGIRNDEGTLTISRSTISENSATSGGGVISVSGPGVGRMTTITNSTISGNTASHKGGGVLSDGAPLS